ncbi:MAG: C45 family autoproteolytic acyltransferase/hydrolase [Actinobacteria bacterium]|nr:C45 family autoproteolytic acyltransferase/hydrolase [Actinomycetota bacterium]
MAKFDGTPYNIGLTHGKSFKKEICASLKSHCNFKISSEILSKICEDAVEKLQHLFPEAVDELKGIADGSGLQFSDVIKLNYWEEINAITGNDNQALCTSIGFKQTLWGPVLGKTTDIEIDQRDEYMLQWINSDNGFKVLHLGKAGTMKSEIGMNEKGLCIGTSSTLPTDIEGSHVERMMLIRPIL